MTLIERIAGSFLSKKKIIKYGSAVLLAAGALFASMRTQEFKDAVCSAPVLDLPQADEAAQ